MKLFDFKGNSGKKITSTIIERNEYRIRETINSWRLALTEAEYKDPNIKPDRRSLYRIYNEILLDNHLQSVIELRKQKVKEFPFYLYVDNEIDLELSKKIDTKWFFELLDYILDIIFYGHSLVQIESIFENDITELTLIDRQNIIPEYAEYMPDVYNNQNTISYLDEPTYKWLFELYNKRNDLGLLKSIAPLVLWKRSAMSAWAEYTEVFGMPIRIAKTTSSVAEDRNRLANFVKNLGKSAWAVIDESETIDFIENKKSDAFNVYDKLIDTVNKEISKAILGVTMLNEDGSSRSQSEVHSEQSEIKTQSDLRNVEFIIKKQVLPKLIRLELLPDNCEFRFDKTESLPIEEQIVIDEKIHNMYPLKKDYLVDKYGVEFEEITFDIPEE